MFNSTPLRTYCQDFSFGHNETVEKLFFRLFPFTGKTSLSRKQNYSPEELCRVLPLAQVVHFEVESTHNPSLGPGVPDMADKVWLSDLPK